jgi:DNA-binding IclR family transcriptional regulator
MPRKKVESSGGGAETGAGKPTLQGVSRALRVLELLARSPMRATDAAAELEMSWATLYRTLSQLEADGFIERDSANVYRTGPRTWLLGSTYLIGHRLLDLGVPQVKQASQEIGGAVFQLVERVGGTAVVLYSQEASSGEVITRTTYGYHFPLHSGSKGLVLLAYADPAFIDDYLAGDLAPLTPATLTDPDEVRARLDEIRTRGVAITVGDVQSFTGSVSAPVFDLNDAVSACVCAVVPRSQVEDEHRRTALVEMVQGVAQSISLGLGWQPVRHRS